MTTRPARPRADTAPSPFGPIAVIGVFGVTVGISYPLFSLMLHHHGVSSGMVGLNGAMTPLGMVLSAAAVPRAARFFGAWQVMVVSALGTAALLCSIEVTDNLPWWFVARFALGSFAVAMFILSETWISEIASEGRRGRLLTAYTSVLALGFSIGPAVLTVSHGAQSVGIGIAAVSSLLALWPLAQYRRAVPAMASSGVVPVRALARGLSVLLVALVAVSVFDAVTLQFLPLYGQQTGLSMGRSTLLLTVLIVGQTTLQYPVGWLADRLGARTALLLSLTVGTAGALALPAVSGSGLWLWPLVALWGGVAFAGYPLVLTLLGETLTGTTLLLGNTAFAIVWGVGGVIGPPCAGLAMGWFGSNGLPWSLALIWAVALLVTGAAFARLRPRPSDCEPGGLYSEFRAAALATPDALAVVGYDGKASTYRSLLRAVDQAAGRLAEELRPDEVLGLAVDDPFAFVSLYLAAAKLDRVVVLLDSRLSAHELARSVAKFDLDRIAVDRPGGFRLQPALKVDSGPQNIRNSYRTGDFVVHCTSGSTGEPKGILMSQQAVLARIRLWSAELELDAADVVLCALPLAHCHGIDVLTLPTLFSGGTVVFARGERLTGRGLARRIEQHEVTLMSGLPVMYRMLTAGSGVPATALRSMRLAISGSAPLALDTQRRFAERYGLPLRQVYGLSEIGVICFDRACSGNGSVGVPINGVEWRLDPVPRGEAEERQLYELRVRGPALARGYYRDAGADAEMFEDGWLRTRDLFQVDAGGWYLRGRQSGFINVAGSKVGPLEVEEALREYPDVLECAVVGVPDANGDQRVAALVVPGSGLAPSAVRRHVADRLLPHQLPQRYHYASALPRTPLGKVDYAAVCQIMQTEPEQIEFVQPEPVRTEEGGTG